MPYIEAKNASAMFEHEATTSKISEEMLFYCMQRGLSAEEATALVVNGFVKDVLQQLPMEFAVEAQKLISISLEGSVGVSGHTGRRAHGGSDVHVLEHSTKGADRLREGSKLRASAGERGRTGDEGQRSRTREDDGHNGGSCAFLQGFYEKDVKRSKKLKEHGIVAAFEDGKLVLQRPAEGQFSDGLMIVVGEHGEIDAGGKSFGRFAPKDEGSKRKELIGEIILHFSL